MEPYELGGVFPVVVLLPLGLGGLWLLFRERPFARWPLFAYLLAWIAFTRFVGATSPYWGEFYQQLAVVGTAVLLAYPLLDDGTAPAVRHDAG